MCVRMYAPIRLRFLFPFLAVFHFFLLRSQLEGVEEDRKTFFRRGRLPTISRRELLV